MCSSASSQNDLSDALSSICVSFESGGCSSSIADHSMDIFQTRQSELARYILSKSSQKNWTQLPKNQASNHSLAITAIYY